MIFLAGIGAEDEETGEVVHKGDVVAQAYFMYDKLKRVLARNGATMADVVKQVTYVTDARFRPEITQCRIEAYGDVPLPAHTFVAVSQLAFTGMQIEIDIIAVTPERCAPAG
jgi:enamine deaminase RidA (YjgF/YER057c/UK114 family)